MEDNVWEYPFGDLEEDDDMFCRRPEPKNNAGRGSLPVSTAGPPARRSQRLFS